MAIDLYSFGILFVSIIALSCAVLFRLKMRNKRRMQIEKAKKEAEELIQQI